MALIVDLAANLEFALVDHFNSASALSKQNLHDRELSRAVRQAGLGTAYVDHLKRLEDIRRSWDVGAEIYHCLMQWRNETPAGASVARRSEEAQLRQKLIAARREYRQLCAAAESAKFELPRGIEESINSKVSEGITAICFSKMVDPMDRRDDRMWRGLIAVDPEWFQAYKRGLAAVLNRRRGLATDWLLRLPGKIEAAIEKLPRGRSPKSALGDLIRSGYFREVGVPERTNLSEAVNRAVHCEKELLRHYLELAGPTSPWTLQFVMSHRPRGERGQVRELDVRCADALGSLLTMIANLGGPEAALGLR
jgi:hypothetical protein